MRSFHWILPVKFLQIRANVAAVVVLDDVAVLGDAAALGGAVVLDSAVEDALAAADALDVLAVSLAALFDRGNLAIGLKGKCRMRVRRHFFVCFIRITVARQTLGEVDSLFFLRQLAVKISIMDKEKYIKC